MRIENVLGHNCLIIENTLIMKNLEHLKLQELDLHSIQTINGGLFYPHLALYLAVKLVEIDATIKEGVKKGYAAATS